MATTPASRKIRLNYSVTTFTDGTRRCFVRTRENARAKADDVKTQARRLLDSGNWQRAIPLLAKHDLLVEDLVEV